MNKKLLIIGHTWPEPQSTAAGTRMLQLIKLFREADYVITFACAASRSDYSLKLSNYQVSEKSILLNDSSFDHWVKEEAFHAVMYDRFMIEEQYGWRFRKSCPNSINILDTEDLHFLRNAREEALKNGQNVSITHLNSKLALREIASIYRCDLTLIISQYEIELLKDQFHIPSFLLHYIPFLLESSQLEMLKPNNYKKFEQREHFTTIGNFIHKPNYDAVYYLKSKIWPLIRKQLPDAQMHIYGAYESPKVSQLHKEQEGFFIKGRVLDAHLAIESGKVLLAPIRYGAGLKGKLFTAMETGTPFVGTSIATEGIYDHNTSDYSTNKVIIPDTAEAFAIRAIDLYSDKVQWNQQQEIGFKILKTRFSSIFFRKDFISKIHHITTELEYHRLQNFMGQLLHQQAFNSTKYFSQWIEEKNRKNH